MRLALSSSGSAFTAAALCAALVAAPLQAGVAKEARTAAKSQGKAEAPSKGGQAIIVLVNDEPVTGYEVEQRQRLLGLSASDIGARATANFKALIARPETSDKLKAILNDTIKANQGKTREQVIAIFEQRKKDFAQSMQKQAVESARASVLPGLRKQALEELIDERLKLQEAKRLSVVPTDEDADRIIKNIADRNKMTIPQFADHLRGLGADINSMRQRFKANMAWQDVVRRRFGHQIAITERDIDKAVASAPAGGEDQVELKVHRITLPVAKLEQKQVAQHLHEADAARARFGGCKDSGAVASSLKGARFEDLGTRKPSTLPEPTRTLLLHANDGDMLPATLGQGGVELWAVCGRNVVKADEAKREAVQSDLRQKEFEIMARKAMKDLRENASLEYR